MKFNYNRDIEFLIYLIVIKNNNKNELFQDLHNIQKVQYEIKNQIITDENILISTIIQTDKLNFNHQNICTIHKSIKKIIISTKQTIP